MQLPEADRALRGFPGKPAVVDVRLPKRSLADRLRDRPVAQNGLDGVPVEAGRLAGDQNQIRARTLDHARHQVGRDTVEGPERGCDLVELAGADEFGDSRIVELVQVLQELYELLGH